MEGGKPENPEKTLEAQERTNKLNSHMKPGPGIELGTIVVRGERSHRCATLAPHMLYGYDGISLQDLSSFSLSFSRDQFYTNNTNSANLNLKTIKLLSYTLILNSKSQYQKFQNLKFSCFLTIFQDNQNERSYFTFRSPVTPLARQVAILGSPGCTCPDGGGVWLECDRRLDLAGLTILPS